MPRLFTIVVAFLSGVLLGVLGLLLWMSRRSSSHISEFRTLYSTTVPSGAGVNKNYTLQTVMNRNMAGLSCEQCDEMFQECIAGVDPDAPLGYEVCQVLWDRCKNECKGTSNFSKTEIRGLVKKAYSSPSQR